jgi:hypothetical protein
VCSLQIEKRTISATVNGISVTVPVGRIHCSRPSVAYHLMPFAYLVATF